MAQTQAQVQAPWQYTASPDMDDVQFRKWVSLLEARTGIILPASRKTFLSTNLHTRMRELGVGDYGSYYHMVTDGTRGNVEWETLVDRLTVHETRFFRDIDALSLIREEYLKPLLTRQREASCTVHVWSVGCATGEEPYSLAMMLETELGGKDDCYYGVTASDISRTAIKAGRMACYHKNRVKNVPHDMADRFLETVDEDHVQVTASLRDKVCFTSLNLLELEQEPIGDMDIILCQNVLIYFEHAFRNRILDQLVARLKPNGLLVLGAGEVFSWTHPQLEEIRHASTQAYRRTQSGGVV